MKTLCLILVLFSKTIESFSQDSQTAPSRVRNNRDNFDMDYDKGGVIIGLYATVVSFRNIETKWGIGMDAEYMLGSHFGFGTKFFIKI